MEEDTGKGEGRKGGMGEGTEGGREGHDWSLARFWIVASVKGKVKSAYEPSGPSSRSLSRFL